METQIDPHRILADLVFDLCPNEEIRNFKRSVFGQEVTIRDEFVNYFKICGYKPLERYLSREALLEDPFWLNVFYEEFTPERPKFKNLRNLFEKKERKTIRRRQRENPEGGGKCEYRYLEPIGMEIKTPAEVADIVFSVVPEEIMERTVREVRGMTFSIRDEFILFFQEGECFVNCLLTSDTARTAALVIFSRGEFNFENPNFLAFSPFFEINDSLSCIDEKNLVGCTKTLREKGIDTIRDVANIIFSVFTDEELERHEETKGDGRITLVDKFTEAFENDIAGRPRLNEYLTRDYIVKTVLIKIFRGEFDIDNPDFSAFSAPFFQSACWFSSGVAEMKGLVWNIGPIIPEEIDAFAP